MRWRIYFYKRVIAALRLDATKNYLGFAIWIIEPILMMATFYFVFEYLLSRGGEGYVQFLLVGIVSWLWFASAINRCTTSIISERRLISQFYVPKFIFPLIDIAVCSIKQIVVSILLLIVLLFLIDASPAWLYFPLLFFIQLSLIIGFGLMISAIVPFFPDIQAFINPLLQLLMFCSGVFYNLEMMPEAIQGAFKLNPMANLIYQYRLILIEGTAPQFLDLAIIELLSIILILFSLFLLQRFDRIYPRILI